MISSPVFDRSAFLLQIGRSLEDRPPCYERCGSLFWKDPWTSSQALEIQLDGRDPEGARSRGHAWSQIDSIIELLPLPPGRALDLGSGPGYHAVALATIGAEVRSIDISREAVRYARSEVSAEGEEIASRITVEEADMLTTEFGSGYDLILLLFGEYCLLTAEERATLLEKSARALRSGGRLVLELFNQPVEDAIVERSWSYEADGGFWSATAYLELSTTEVYPEASALCHRFLIAPDGGPLREERIWETSMDEQSLSAEAAIAGLTVETTVWDHPLFDGGGEEEGRRWFLAILKR